MIDSWLTRHVRPIVLLLFTVSYILGWYIGLNISALQEIMLVIYGFYFTSRGTEKVLKTTTKN